MNLGGIPPMSGFIGKIGLWQAGAGERPPFAWRGPSGGAPSAPCWWRARAKVWNRAFWGVTPAEQRREDALAQNIDPDEFDDEDTRPMPPLQVGATMGLVAFSLALTVFAGPLYEYAHAAATALHDGSYVLAVLPEGLR